MGCFWHGAICAHGLESDWQQESPHKELELVGHSGDLRFEVYHSTGNRYPPQECFDH